jgi:hypothetical protein
LKSRASEQKIPADAKEKKMSAQRDEGIRLLQNAAGAMHPGTNLATAAVNLYESYLGATDADDKATDIAHCGICFWFSVLSFFRLGARTNIASCKSGAPEELFLTITLKPDEYPGGAIGDRLRGAVSPGSMAQIKRCLEAAQSCFRRAEELGKPGLGVLWQVALLRGTGRYPECVAAATAARSKVGQADRKDIDSYARTYAGYESDFNWLEAAPCSSIVVPSKWVQPEILECMSHACELVEADLARNPDSQTKPRGGDASHTAIEKPQQQNPKEVADMMNQNQSTRKATEPVTFNCPSCGEPVLASHLAKSAMFTGVKDEDMKCPWCSRRIELPREEHERLVALALKEFNDFDPNTVDQSKLFDDFAAVSVLERSGGLRIITHAGRTAIRVTDKNAAEALLREADLATEDSGRKLLQEGELRGVHAEHVLARLKEHVSGKKAQPTAGSPNQQSGCFVATAVYGNYQCAEVRMFRQYRDEVLSRSLIGRAMIRLYYNVGPHLAALISTHPIRKKVCRHVLDRVLSHMRRIGIEHKQH